MDSPGITVRPIPNIDMGEEFCETFFDNVRVPKGNLVGRINQGWTMAKNLLSFERIGSGSPRQSTYALGRLKLLAERMGVWDDEVFQDRYTQAAAGSGRSQVAVSGICRSGAAWRSRSGRMCRC